ncbi:aldo/keto reductase [Micromonospora zamorensis]|uniref:aldo/keto reductase n=1 Tax=Micromonospora zamorensis TaxID=709883 RepID=UPI003D9933E1
MSVPLAGAAEGALGAGVGLTVWSPLAGRFLSGKVSRDGAVADSGARSAQPGYASFTPFDSEHAFAVVDVLKGVAERHEVSPARVAVAWLLSRPAVTSVIVGARKQEQLVDNIAASDLTLTEQDLTELDEATKLPVAYPNWIQEGFFAGLRHPQ